MSRPWYLAIDLGTGGTKVGAVTRDGGILCSAYSSVDTDLIGDGGAEQDTDQWWTGTVQSIRDVVTKLDQAGDCAGIGITGQWGSTVAVGSDGSALAPCVLWSDRRGAPWSQKITGGMVNVSGYAPARILRWLRLTGGAPNPNGADPTGHVQYLQHQRPGVYLRADALIEPVDFLGLRLTGRLAATPASMVASWLTDNRPGAQPAYDAKLVRLARRDPAKLPSMVATGTVLGTLLPAVAAELELPVATPVVCGVPDLHTAAIGAGAVMDFAGHIAISSTAWVSAPVAFKKTSIANQMASIPGLRAGSYLIANNQETGGAALRWLRDSVLTGSDYDELVAEAATAAPGSGGVIFCPWLNGERSPVQDQNLRAGFLNVSVSTTRADLIRAVLEGVAYNGRTLLEATEKFAGRRLSELRLIGGGAKSDLWCQIYADVIGRSIYQVADPVHVNLRGAAWFAALHLQHLTLEQIASQAPTARVFEPSAGNAPTYERLYDEFARLAKHQRKMYRRLNGPAVG